MLNAFIVMQAERMRTLADLSEKLKSNPILRHSFGFSALEKHRLLQQLLDFFKTYPVITP